MAFSLIPRFACQSVLELTPEWLQQRGIRLLLADLDNTLTKYGQEVPNAEIVAWRNDLHANNITLCLLSNSRKPWRVDAYRKSLDVPGYGHVGKPRGTYFQKAMAEFHVTPGETAIVGDQIFTDVLGGNLAGIMTILVEPLALAGNPGRYLRYGIEYPFRALGRRRGLCP